MAGTVPRGMNAVRLELCRQSRADEFDICQADIPYNRLLPFSFDVRSALFTCKRLHVNSMFA